MNVLNENKEKPGVSKARYCTKSKKEVWRSCCEQLPCLSTWQWVRVTTDYAATWLSSSCHISASIAF